MKAANRLSYCLAALATAAFVSAASANVGSTFDTDGDGWMHAPGGDPGSTVTYSATGGNPGGRVVLFDAGQGTNDFFAAPAKFLGDDSMFYNGSFSFQLMDDSSVDNLGALLSITDGSGNTLTHALSTFASGSYASFSFTLNTSGGWLYNGGAPTAGEFQAVLSNVSSLFVPGDLHNGTENMSLDNVLLAAPVPEPSTWAMIALGGALLGALMRFRPRHIRL